MGFNLEECGELVQSVWHDPRRHSADVKKRGRWKVADRAPYRRAYVNSTRDQLLALAESCPGDDGADSD